MAAKSVFFLDSRIKSTLHYEFYFLLIYYISAIFICFGILYFYYKMTFSLYMKFSKITAVLIGSFIFVTFA